MDIIAALTALGLDPNQAQGLAGTVLGQLKANLPADQAATVEQHVPELGAWSQSADAANPLGGLLGALGGGGGAAGAAGALATLASLGVTPDKIQAAIPQVLAFLRERLPEPLAAQLEQAAQGLMGGEGNKPDLGGLLGGLFGKS